MSAVVPAGQMDPVPYYAEIKNAAHLHRIPEPLIAAVIRCESNWDPGAESSKGARGLMQILPRTAVTVYGVGPALLWDPWTNISVGTAYLRRLADRSQPWACSECGLPNPSSSKGRIASHTRGSSGVLA